MAVGNWILHFPNQNRAGFLHTHTHTEEEDWCSKDDLAARAQRGWTFFLHFLTAIATKPHLPTEILTLKHPMHNVEEQHNTFSFQMLLRGFTQLTCANTFLSQCWPDAEIAMHLTQLMSSRVDEHDLLKVTSLACFLLDLTQDVEERRLHSVAVERMFSETQHKAAVKRLNTTIFHSAKTYISPCCLNAKWSGWN